MSEERIVLPEKYYLDNFNYLLEFVQNHSEHLLVDSARSFISTFNALSEDAQCTYIRLINRKGPIFRLSQLHYSEIGDIPMAMMELEEAEFIEPVEEPSEFVFNLFRKDELLELFEEVEYAKKFRKEDLIIEIVSEVKDWWHRLMQADQQIMPDKLHELEYIKMLFFGHYKGMMSDFVVRDIGNVKLENLNEDKFKPWFNSIEEALATFEVSQLYEAFRHGLQTMTIETVEEVLSGVEWDKFTLYPKARKISDKLLIKLGQELERNFLADKALKYYHFTLKPPSRERQIRILDQLGKTEEAQTIANEVMKSHKNAAEYLFAKDFLERTKKRINRSTTKAFEQAVEISINNRNEFRTVEQAVLYHFAKTGNEGIHAENFLWRSIFGITFWELLYDQEILSFHNPLQRHSNDIYEGNHKELFENYLKRFRQKKQLSNYWLDIINKKAGLSNPFVYWHDDLELYAEKLIQLIPIKGLKNILLKMSENLKDNSTGFPDLFIWSEEGYHFYEVKSPNDHLSPQQLYWIEQFKANKINCDILRVHYH